MVGYPGKLANFNGVPRTFGDGPVGPRMVISAQFI